MSALLAYSWPGNARELKSAFEFATVSCPGGMIGVDHLPPQISANPLTGSAIARIGQESLDDVKRKRLIDALNRTGGNQSKAARLLGISRTSVWNQIKKYHIQVGP